MSKFIVVEGNIGTGKSTVVPLIAEAIGYKQIQEPADDPKFLELLNEFTSNPTKTEPRLRFQRYITETRAALLKDVPEGNYVIERSLFSDLVFCQVNMLAMERPDGQYLGYYYDIIDRLTEYPTMDAVVYIKTDPLISYERMMLRGRGAEDGTPFEYLQDLHNYHNASLPQICREYDTPLIEVETYRWQSPEAVSAVCVSKLMETTLL